MMVIQLSPALEERILQAANAKGIQPEVLVEQALDKYLAGDGEQVSEARRQLNELLKHTKPVDDFDTAVHEARRYARQLEEDNAEWIDP